MQTHDPYALEHLSDEEFWDLAFAKAFPDAQLRSLASPISPDAQTLPSSQQHLPAAEEMYVVCDDAYAFPLTALYEIINMPQHISFLPDTPSWMSGLMAWRGHVLATIDLYAYLLKESKETKHAVPAHERSLLIAHHGDTLLAFAAIVEQTVSLSTSTHTILDVTALFEDIEDQLKKIKTHE